MIILSVHKNYARVISQCIMVAGGYISAIGSGNIEVRADNEWRTIDLEIFIGVREKDGDRMKHVLPERDGKGEKYINN